MLMTGADTIAYTGLRSIRHRQLCLLFQFLLVLLRRSMTLMERRTTARSTLFGSVSLVDEQVPATVQFL